MKFRKPLRIDEDGFYITEGQMQFFLNFSKGKYTNSLALIKSDAFMDYYENCIVYNIVYDMMEEDPDCAQMFWDEEKQEISFQFPEKGKVMKKIRSANVEFFDVDDEEDEWGLGVE